MGNDVVFNIRERGAAATARDVDKVGKGFTSLGRRVRGGGNDVRFFNRATVSATGNLRLFGGAALYGGAAAGGVLVLGLKRAVDQYEDARTVGLSTNTVIKSTGGVANVTRREVDALATSLSRKAGIDDEAIARGENFLLTFRKIRNDVGAGNDIFTQASRTMVDLSAGLTAMGRPTSITAAGTMLGKALNDPVRGATALGRTGAIDKQAVERIKEMDEAGASIRSMQKFILREVNAQFGGQAAATATPLKRLGVGIENIEESIGKGLSPATDAVAVKLGKLADDAAPKFDALGNRIEHVFDRKDLDFTQKLGLSAHHLSHTLRPYERALGHEIKKLHLGDKLADSVEYAVPKIADAAARAAPHAAEAFLHGWLHAGIWGKLLTLGLLERKLGVFSTLGGLASGRFTRSFVAGEAARQTQFTALGSKLGRWLGPAMGIAAAALIIPEILKEIEGVAGLTPEKERRQLGDAHARMEYFKRADAQFLKRKPWAKKYQDTYFDLSNQLGGMRTGAIPATAEQERYTARRVRELRAYLRSIEDPHVMPIARSRRQAQDLHINLYLDGKHVAKVVKRVNDDRDARR